MAARRVLVIGSGRVCPPLVEYLTRDGSVSVTVGECCVMGTLDACSGAYKVL